MKRELDDLLEELLIHFFVKADYQSFALAKGGCAEIAGGAKEGS